MKTLLITAVAAGAIPLVAAAQYDAEYDDGDAQHVDLSLKAMATYWNTDDLGDAWGGQVGVGFKPIEWFSADLRTGYLRADEEDLDIVPIELVAAFRLTTVDVIEPYVGLGAGYYFLESDEIDAENRQALFPVVGLEVRLADTNLRLFGEARYMFFDESVTSAIDSDLNGLGASLGVVWRF